MIGRTTTDILKERFPKAEFLLSYSSDMTLHIDYYYRGDITEDIRKYLKDSVSFPAKGSPKDIKIKRLGSKRPGNS